MANLYSSYEISRWLRKYSKLLNMADSSSETDFRSSLAFLNISLYYSTLDSFSSNGYKTRQAGGGVGGGVSAAPREFHNIPEHSSTFQITPAQQQQQKLPLAISAHTSDNNSDLQNIHIHPT